MKKKSKSEFEQLMFFRQCYDRFIQATDVTGKIWKHYIIANTRVSLCFAGDSMINILTKALEHLEVFDSSEPDMIINIWDSNSSNIEMVPPPCDMSDFTDRGDIWGFKSKRIKTAFHWSEYSVNVMDLETNSAVYWVKTPESFPYWVYSSPFRTIFHWWMEKNNCQLIHAAAIATEKGAILITGKGGAGKSTIALSGLNNGLFYLGDDYVIVKNNPEPIVYSLYNTGKVNIDDLERYPHLKSFVAELLEKDQEKYILFPFPGMRHKIIKEQKIIAVLTPEVVENNVTDIVPISFLYIQRAMSFTTLSQLPGVGIHTHDYINRLISGIPCFKIRSGKDLNGITDSIKLFIENKDLSESRIMNPLSNNQKPLVSIIIPVFNGEEFIFEAIRNISSQNYEAIEIIIVDDGSTDNSKKIIENLDVDVRYFYQFQEGPASARNRGIQDASGEFIAFLDVDDLWPENNLNLLVDELVDNKDIDVVRGYAQLFERNESGEDEYTENPLESFKNYIGAGVYRKSVFEKVGLFDKSLLFGEDEDWYVRANEMNIKMKRLHEVTLFVRRHGGNMTKGKSLLELNTLKVAKKTLDRIRSKRRSVNEDDSKLISVIIPVYNGERYISEAIESVLAQNIESLEIIIVNDGSVDKSVQIACQYNDVKILNHDSNKGAAAARNTGIASAQGEYLAFLDADDIWTNGKLLNQLRIFDDYPDVNCVFGMVEMFVSPELTEDERKSFNADIKKSPGFLLGCMLIKHKDFLKVGHFNEMLQLGEFIDWFGKAREKGFLYEMSDDIVLKRRLHTTNSGITKKDHLTDYTTLLRSGIARKRRKK